MFTICSGKKTIFLWVWLTLLVGFILFVPSAFASLGILESTDPSQHPENVKFMIFSLIYTGCFAYAAMIECRTIILTKEGCAIEWWKFRSFHTWDEMRYREWKVYPAARRARYRTQEFDMIWLSTSPVSERWRPHAMPELMLNPMGRVCICFFPKGYQGDRELHGYSFAVDKEIFLDFMEDIGVAIEGIDEARRYG